MIPLGVQVYVATKPVDFRKGAEGLSALVRDGMKRRSILCRALRVPRERADRIKLVSGRQGVCLFANYVHSYYTSFSFS